MHASYKCITLYVGRPRSNERVYYLRKIAHPARIDPYTFVITIRYRNVGATLNNCKSEESEGEVDNPVIEEYDVPLAHAAPSITTGREYLQPGASYKMYPRYPKQLCETSFTSFDNEIHDILSSHSSQRVTYDEDDYDKMFLLSLLPIIRQVPEEKKLDVRIQMQQVLALALRPPDNKQ